MTATFPTVSAGSDCGPGVTCQPLNACRVLNTDYLLASSLIVFPSFRSEGPCVFALRSLEGPPRCAAPLQLAAMLLITTAQAAQCARVHVRVSAPVNHALACARSPLHSLLREIQNISLWLQLLLDDQMVEKL